MTADSILSVPPYKADDQDVVVELNSRFGAETFTVQSTRTGMPVLWVARDRLINVLTFLRDTRKDVLDAIKEKKVIDEAVEKALTEAITAFKQGWKA